MTIKLRFPVIVLPREESMLYVHFRDKDLKSTNEDLLSKIDYKKIELIDSLGKKYKIKRAFKVKYLGLWGFNPLLKGRQILIDFEYETEIENVSLDDLKREAITRVENKKKFRKSGWNIEDLKCELQNSNTFERIAELLR